MKFPPFQYLAPGGIDDVIRLLGETGDDDRRIILAGGQSVFPLLARRLIAPDYLIDINGLSDALGGYAWEGATLSVGALTRQCAVEKATDIAARLPILAEAVGLVGRPAVRTRGTIGGSLAFADPAGEIPTVACALDAEMTVVGPHGERTVAAADFFVRPQATALSRDELLTHVRFPVPPAEGSGSAFIEVSRRYADRCVIGAAAAVVLDRTTIADVRLAFANVADTPVRAERAESLLRDQELSADAVAHAAAAAAEDLLPPSDQHGSSEYRQHLAGVLARRALTMAIDRAGGTL